MTNERTFRDSLEKMEYPCLFPFKFIVPIDKLDELLAQFQNQETSIRLSSKGNYASLTAKSFVISPEKVVEVFNRVGKIEGVISL
jgi:uncharacterized protein